jgi:nitrogen regulatory protein PII
MKRIEAVIRPHRLVEVLTALVKMQVGGVTVVDSLGFGRQPGHSEVYEEVRRGPNMEVGLVPKKLLIMIVDDEQVSSIVEAVTQIARTGHPGDGKISVSDVHQLVRIRDGI